VIAGEYDGARVNYFLGFFDGSASSLKPSVGFYNGSWRTCQSADAISLDAPHHLVGTWDGTDLKIYVDNVLKNTTTPGSSPTTGTSNYFIGSRWDNAASPAKFKGRIDEVAIYGTTLNSTQVGTHYAAGAQADGTATPSAVAGVGSVPAPSASGQAKATPSATAGVGAVPAPSAFVNSSALPAAVAGIGAVPAPTVFGAVSATATPGVVAGIGRVPHPHALGEGTGSGGGSVDGVTDFWSIKALG